MMLNIIKYSNKLDWQSKGHFGNVDFGIKYTPTLKLVPFKIQTSKALTVSMFEVRKVNPLERNIGVEVLQTITLDVALLQQYVGIFNDNWYYLSTSDISEIGEGIWQFYIKFGNGDEYQSELMRVPCAGEIITCLPDFNNDFNSDFLTCDLTPSSFALFNYGNLYNWYAVNTGKLAPAGYRVPSSADCYTLMSYLGGTNVAGGKMKSTRITVDGVPIGWNTPNTLASNDFGLNFLGSGTRFGGNGAFAVIGELGYIYTTDSISNFYALRYDNAMFEAGGTSNKAGFSARPMRTATAFEQTMPDGTIIETVFDASGYFYNAIKIGTQVWFNQNLKTTKYNDGTDITLVTDNSAWAALATEAYCTYNNDLLSDYEDPTFLYYE